MTRSDYRRAQRLVDKLVQGLDTGEAPELLSAATQLRKLLSPPPTMAEILLKIPGKSKTERAGMLGVSRPYYYTIEAGSGRRSKAIVTKLAELTGVPEDVIMACW